jgi:hypothetical protein
VIVQIAGPIGDVLMLVGLVTLVISIHERSSALVESALIVVTFIHAVVTIGSLWPQTLANGLDSDTLAILRTLRLDPETVAIVCRDERARAATADAWRAFVRGEHARALSLFDEGVQNDDDRFLPGRSLYVWTVRGPEAAVAAIARERAELRRAARIERAGRPEREAHRARVRALHASLHINEAFFQVELGGPAALDRALWCMHLARTRCPMLPAVHRTLGLVRLHRGEVERGLRDLERAWSGDESEWARCACACYLAFGHALRGDERAAESYLERAAAIDGSNILLAPYRARVRTALERAAKKQ